jgi:O-antigen ligase
LQRKKKKPGPKLRMLSYYKDNITLYLLFVIWVMTGAYAGPVVFAVIPFTMFLMKQKLMYEELLIGYLFILVISDSKEPVFEFAKNAKSIYLVTLAFIVLLDRANFAFRNNLFRIFIPFFIVAIIAMLFSTGDSFFLTSVQKTLSYILSMLVLPLMITRLYKDHGPVFLRRLILFAVTVLFFGFVMEYVSPETALLLGKRFKGIFGGPNGLGVFCVLLFIIFFMVNNFFPDQFSKYEKVIIMVSILVSIYSCGSRNAVISVIIFFVFQRFFSLSPFFGFVLFLITIFVTELISSNATAVITALGMGDYFRINTIEEGSGRYIAWDFAWKQIQNNFFIGKGFAYDEFYMRKHYGMLLKLNHQGGVHNSFLTFWMNQGLIGLIVYLRSYILTFIKGAQKNKYAFPAMFAISFSAFFESWLVASLSAFAFLGIFIFTFITSDEIVPQEEKEETLTGTQLAVIN